MNPVGLGLIKSDIVRRDVAVKGDIHRAGFSIIYQIEAVETRDKFDEPPELLHSLSYPSS